MAIHYKGTVQRNPGRRACKAAADKAPATAEQWHATTCGPCMVKGLLGLKLVHVEPGSVPGTVVNVSRYEVGATFLDDEPAPTSIAMSELDSGNWVPYQEAPEPAESEADEQ